MSAAPHTDRLAEIEEECREGLQASDQVIMRRRDYEWLIARIRELEAELSRDRAQGGLTMTYASGIHAPNMQGCTQERDNG